jgi:hypothetical protein
MTSPIYPYASPAIPMAQYWMAIVYVTQYYSYQVSCSSEQEANDAAAAEVERLKGLK